MQGISERWKINIEKIEEIKKKKIEKDIKRGAKRSTRRNKLK